MNNKSSKKHGVVESKRRMHVRIYVYPILVLHLFVILHVVSRIIELYFMYKRAFLVLRSEKHRNFTHFTTKFVVARVKRELKEVGLLC